MLCRIKKNEAVPKSKRDGNKSTKRKSMKHSLAAKFSTFKTKRREKKSNLVHLGAILY